jgi:hypothetical protein
MDVRNFGPKGRNDTDIQHLSICTEAPQAMQVQESVLDQIHGHLISSHDLTTEKGMTQRGVIQMIGISSSS